MYMCIHYNSLLLVNDSNNMSLINWFTFSLLKFCQLSAIKTVPFALWSAL